jgi:hypothetical protein
MQQLLPRCRHLGQSHIEETNCTRRVVKKVQRPTKQSKVRSLHAGQRARQAKAAKQQVCCGSECLGPNCLSEVCLSMYTGVTGYPICYLSYTRRSRQLLACLDSRPEWQGSRQQSFCMHAQLVATLPRLLHWQQTHTLLCGQLQRAATPIRAHHALPSVTQSNTEPYTPRFLHLHLR